MAIIHINDTDNVRTLTIDRPGGHNAIGTDLLGELAAALEATKADARIRALILTGAGSMFSAGGNLQALVDSLSSRDVAVERASLEAAVATVDLLRTMPIPTLAAVNGPAAGGGFALALACDLRIASPCAKFAYAYGAIGLAGDLGINWLLVRTLGQARARTVAFGGTLDAQAACAIGLVDSVVADADLAAEAARRARMLASIPPFAAAGIKDNLDFAADHDFASSATRERESFQMLRSSPAHRAAVEAIVKRTMRQ
ncbi:enoyl-CoA hydratase/isomerase family protein [Sphingobium sp.]|uniref:enoyl-CoA hydratase/isomerase family protein n=1 Tax=Sphingobium TaxID=165695 RepID=UPI001A18A8C8|nr:enoyl-CoA hydratase/isomerase family protein [Sphingobium sp.]MBJ7375298.1 enoyl-CoA hydratase/isomerase family protein [Sphingobium sp.]